VAELVYLRRELMQANLGQRFHGKKRPRSYICGRREHGSSLPFTGFGGRSGVALIRTFFWVSSRQRIA
jgi:hypothetical protein